MRILSGILPGHVLQRTPRGASATVLGETTAAGPVTATVSSKGRPLKGWSGKKVGKAGSGRFTATLKGLPTGGPYALTLQSGKERCKVGQFFVGDLWLMAGQSNAEGVGNLVDAPKPHPLVRNFSMALRWEAGRDPLHHLPESPHAIHNGGAQPQTGAVAAKAKRIKEKGVGFGVYFANDMQRRTGVPQGLIATAHGGTSMEQWDPAKRNLGGGSLYGSMLASLRQVNQPLAGVLWYQGESDADPAVLSLYTPRMQQLVAAVRADQRQPRLPWVVAQIGRHVYDAGQRAWNGIQEQERLLPRVIPQLDVVPTVDLEIDDVIHISGKDYAILGKRMAHVAARLAHGDRREPPAIQPVSARVMSGTSNVLKIEVRFANVVGGLRSAGFATGFVFVDPDHRAFDLVSKTVLDGDRVILELGEALVRNDLRLQYGWGRNPRCNISDARGMAVPVFGPMRLANQNCVSPWFATWDVSGILPGEDIARLPRPTAKSVGRVERKGYPPTNWGSFVNEHPEWLGKTGHAAFFSEVTVPEAMNVELRLGYDGPFRIWLGDKEVHRDLKGTNPAVLDNKRIPLRLRPGRQRLTVLMALNQGRAWGFYLRFARTDTKQQPGEHDQLALPISGL